MGVSERTSVEVRPECEGNQQIAIIGVLSEDDFERARMTMPEFSGYLDYENYYLERESLQLGLSLAGFSAVMLPFELSSLLEWRKLCGMGEFDEDVSDAHDLWIGTMH
jgi:hypothetical protein